MLNSLVLLSSIKDQSPITQNRCILMDCRTREYSEIGDSSQGIDVCREERERVSRYHEGTNSVRGRKNGRGDKERKENVEPTLGLLHSFISPDLRHQVVELGPKILREKKMARKEDGV